MVILSHHPRAPAFLLNGVLFPRSPWHSPRRSPRHSLFSDDIPRSLLFSRGTWRTFRGIPWNTRTHSPLEIVKYHSNLVNCTMGDWTHYANVLRSNYTVITRRDKPLTSCFQNLRYWHYSCVNVKTQTHDIWGMYSNWNWYRAQFWHLDSTKW